MAKKRSKRTSSQSSDTTETTRPPALGELPVPREPHSNRPQIAADIMKAAVSKITKKLGRNDRLVEAQPIIHVLPVPSLAVRYLLQSSGLPLSRFYHLIGPPASYKSTFAVEIGRWHRACGGYIFLNEAETKGTPDLRMSILDWDSTGFRVDDCEFIDDWEQRVMWYTDDLQKRMSADEDVGRSIPVAFIVDSLMGKTTRDQAEKIAKEGSAKQAYPVEAQSITKWLRTYISKLLGWPFTLIGVNHARLTLNPITQREEHNSPAGWFVKFQDAAEIFMEKRGSRQQGLQDGVPFYETNVNLRMTKNSYGIDGKRIQVTVRHWGEQDEATGQSRLFSSFEWRKASTLLLFEGLGMAAKEKEMLLPAIKEIIDIRKKARGQFYWCDRLGIGTNDAVDAHTLGVAIEDNEEVLHDLYPLLGITKRPLFQPGVDYMEQLNDYVARTES